MKRHMLHELNFTYFMTNLVIRELNDLVYHFTKLKMGKMFTSVFDITS